MSSSVHTVKSVRWLVYIYILGFNTGNITGTDRRYTARSGASYYTQVHQQYRVVSQVTQLSKLQDNIPLYVKWLNRPYKES